MVAIKDTNMVRKQVKRFNINKSNEGLGLYVNPDGSMSLQVKKVVEKINIWSGRLGASSLNRKEAYNGANSTIFKKVEYALPGTSYSDQECYTIERAIGFVV